MSDEVLEHEDAFPRLTRDLLAVLEAAVSDARSRRATS
jgi:hypothetical protein